MKIWLYLAIGVLLTFAVVASFLEYELTITEDDVQSRLDAVLPISGERLLVPYNISTAKVNLNAGFIDTALEGDLNPTTLIIFDVVASGELDYRNSIFYLTDFTFTKFDTLFGSAEDEVIAKSGFAAGTAWAKEKLKAAEITEDDSEYKAAMKGIVGKYARIAEQRATKIAADPEAFIQAVLEDTGGIPLYNLRNGPFLVSTFGAMVNNVQVNENEIVISYSPRIIWLWILVLVIVGFLVYGLVRTGTADIALTLVDI